MASDYPNPPGGPDRDDMSFRQLTSGSIRHLVLSDGEQIIIGGNPEILVQIAGRGRVIWPGATGNERASSTLFMPPNESVCVQGNIRALRVVLQNLRVTLPVGPVSEVLVGLLCRRSWHASEAAAEAALVLINRLIEDEARGIGGRRPNGRG